MTIGTKFLKASLIYFAVTVSLGVIFIVRPFHSFVSSSTYVVESHAHLSLIGWVSMSMLGLIYCYMEDKGIKFNDSSANKSFLYLNIGVIMMPGMLFLAEAIRESAPKVNTEPIIGIAVISAVIMVLGVYTSVYTIIKALK